MPPTPARQYGGGPNDPARRFAPVVVTETSSGGFWAGALACTPAVIALLVVVLLWRLVARGGAVLRLEFLTPQGLDAAGMAALSSTPIARHPGEKPLVGSSASAASSSDSTSEQIPPGQVPPGQIPQSLSGRKLKRESMAPPPQQVSETFADKKTKVTQQREKREAAILQHVFQENLKLREQFQSNKKSPATRGGPSNHPNGRS